MGLYLFSAAVLYVVTPACICIYLGEPLDVSNVLRLEPQGEDDFLPYGKLVIEIRGDARSLPVVNTTLRSDETPCCRLWKHEGWSELNESEALKTGALLDAKSNLSQVWVLQNDSGELVSPPGPQNKGSSVCVTVLVRLPENSSLSVYARLPTGNPRETRIIEIKGIKSGAWTLRRGERRGHRSFRNQPLQLVLRAKQQGNESVLVQWASFCDSNDDVSTYSFHSYFSAGNATSVFPTAGIGSGELILLNRFGAVSNVCLNGGNLNKEFTLCECAPGFSGGVCERGCGSNRFGIHCEGRCSKDPDRNCRGVFVCSKKEGCRCVSGLEGEKCDSPCSPGSYGSGCRLRCGVCAEGRPCDRHTGECLRGCEGSRQPPYCESGCGVISASQSLISYAEDADAEDFPWHAGVYRTQKNFEPQIQCAGTLVRQKYVISAAHCFFSERHMRLEPANEFRIAFGKTYNEWNAEEVHQERAQFRGVRSIHIPDLYRGILRSYSNDIALLKLSVVADINEYVLPICFDWTGGYETELQDGDVGTIVGWGKTEKGDTSYNLKKADLPFIPTEDCIDALPISFQKFVTDDKFCVGIEKMGGAVVNKGDSGGGLIMRQGQAWYLRGIVSVGLPEETPFTVYTNVSHFRTWITTTWNVLDLEDAASET